MNDKIFVTDCEGPLTLNDNAFELSKEFIPNGDKFFKIISNYDDYLVEVIQKPGYNAGDTLKLILPFLIAYNLNNNKTKKFAQKTVKLVPGSKETIKYIKHNTIAYIISTSYQQYIETICKVLDFPIDNTYYTKLDFNKFNISGPEIKKIKEYLLQILSNNNNNHDFLDKIFFKEIPKMSFYDSLNKITTIGGIKKEQTLKEIINNNNSSPKKIIYMGDSITDLEPLQYIKKNNGLSIAFNGNKFAINSADIAIISNNTLITSIITDLFNISDKKYIYEFITDYNINKLNTLKKYNINISLIKKFKSQNNNLPIITTINKENIDWIKNKSTTMRKNIRGESIGSLG